MDYKTYKWLVMGPFSPDQVESEFWHISTCMWYISNVAAEIPKHHGRIWPVKVAEVDSDTLWSNSES